MDLKTESLESLCELVVDCPHSTPKWTDSGIVVLRNQNIKNGVLDLNTPSFTNEEDYLKRIKRAVPQAGDIVITREAPMGEVCMIPEGVKCCLGQRQVLLRPRSDVCGEYLFWALQSPYVQHQISWNEGTGTTVSNVRIPVLKALMIPRQFDNERSVAQALTRLADKIELNKQTNQTLEQMAQTLFKSWFVDFDPVFDNRLAKADFKLENLASDFPEALLKRAQKRLLALDDKAKTALLSANSPSGSQSSEEASQTNNHRHFPSEFILTKEPSIGIYGWIPKGWDYGSFSRTASLKTKSVHPNKTPDKYWSQFSLPAFDSGKTPSIDIGIEIRSGKYQLTENTVLVSKLNPKTPRVWMPNVLDVKSSVCSTEFMPFEPIVHHQRPFIYSLMCSQKVQLEIASRVTGTTGSHQRVNPKNISILPVILPPEDSIDLFCKVVQSQFDKIDLITYQSIELTKLRDTLLPKLISGKLTLPTEIKGDV